MSLVRRLRQESSHRVYGFVVVIQVFELVWVKILVQVVS